MFLQHIMQLLIFSFFILRMFIFRILIPGIRVASCLLHPLTVERRCIPVVLRPQFFTIFNPILVDERKWNTME